MMTNLAYQMSETIKKTIPWNYLVNEISKVFKLSHKEKKDFESSSTAKLIATIPFEAGCYEPERTAIAHLGLYVMEKRGFQKYCAHTPIDDVNILHRLDFISTFEGGDTDIIEHGMYLLALIMLEGYNRSANKDLKKGIYNPIACGRWNYGEKKKEIEEKLKKIKCPVLDSILFFPDISWPSRW